MPRRKSSPVLPHRRHSISTDLTPRRALEGAESLVRKAAILMDYARTQHPIARVQELIATARASAVGLAEDIARVEGK